MLLINDNPAASHFTRCPVLDDRYTVRVSISAIFIFEMGNMSNCETIPYYTIIRVDSAFSLVASCVLLKYTRTDDVN